ncbi:hypothetical protein [Fischerella thermalis]|uniref:hypothetical protein n=1 Tax=Fischerella thermalis TaxID=372787 RepID=UPI000C809B36|nr:hypothetical protein [Fischerella thermalis]MBF2069108.1 hypothetical protein [Fischerella thermalis M48_A2018_028]PLZ88031.1 hypothetical protein CI593_15030 [Fischerella thermalis CCMEE 5194]
MKCYKAYNLCIACELPLPELMESESEPDVIVRFGDVNDAIATQHDGGTNIVGGIPEVGKFFIQNGREIVINPLPDVDEAVLRTVLLGPVLCALLRQRGLLVLHASCVDINHQGVAFLGGSGWGKSTLATAFHNQGYAVLTDDVMAIQIQAGRPLVLPAYPQFKVFPEALSCLGYDTKNLSPVYQSTTKLAYKFTRGFQQIPLPLQRVYVLDKGSEHLIVKMQPQEAFVALVRHTRAMGVLTKKEFVANHLRLCSELIKSVKFSRFTRKPSLEDLPNLVKLVEDDISNTLENSSDYLLATKS